MSVKHYIPQAAQHCLLLLLALMLVCSSTQVAAEDNQSVKVEDSTETDRQQQSETFREKLAKNIAASQQRTNSGVQGPELRPAAEGVVQKTVYFIGFILLALSLFKKWAKRTSSAPTSEAIEIIARRSLNGRLSILIVDVDGERFLLTQNNEQLALLAPLRGQQEKSKRTPAASKEAPLGKRIEKLNNSECKDFQQTLSTLSSFDQALPGIERNKQV